MTSFSLSDPEFNSNRYQVYKDLQEQEPVYFYHPMATWLVTRYEDISKLLRSKLVTTDYLIQDKLNHIQEDQNIVQIRDTIKKWMIYNEAPTHTRLRKFMNMAFKRQYIDAVMPKIKGIVRTQLENVDFSVPVDFVAAFAHPIPAVILSSMIGLEEIKLQTFVKWSDSIANFMQDFVVAPSPNPEIARDTAQDLSAMKSALSRSISIRKEEPKNDLLSHLVNELKQNEGIISEDELMLQLIHLIFGGHKIPQFVMSNLMHCLLNRPNLLKEIMLKPDLYLMGAIHESMRFESPIQFITRHATEDFHLHGKHIKKGDSIYLMLGAANRDKNVFNNPDAFEISRPTNKHLSFGSGVHTCIGTALVKDELHAIFNAFFEIADNITALYDLSSPDWTNNATFHGIVTQPLNIHQRGKFKSSNLPS